MTQTSVDTRLFRLKSSKFKDDIFSLRYVFPNEEPTITLVNIVSYLMTDRTLMYPTKKAMNIRMDELFGLSISAKTTSIGYTFSLELRVKVLNPRYAKALKIQDVLDFVVECIMRPLINTDTVEEAKLNMTNALARAEDNPSVFGFRLAAESIAQNEPLYWFSQGSLKHLKTIGVKNIQEFHQRMIKQKPYVFIGSEHTFPIDNLLMKLGSEVHDLDSAYVFPIRFKTEVKVQKNIPQSTLTQLYASQTHYSEPDYLALRIMTILLGQLPTSLLFTEIREKRSLCYSIHASTLNFDGVMVIQTGIDASQVQYVNQLIEAQLTRLREGKFSKRLVEMAKKLMISTMESLDDDRAATFNFVFQRTLNHQEHQIPTILKQIKSITKEDVIRASKKLVLISQSLIEGENR